MNQPLSKKKRGIRAIDQGTRYDITGNLRRLVRAIEAGEYNNVRHGVVGIKANDNEAQTAVYTTLGFGNSTMADLAFTCDYMKRRIVGGNF